jgi:hypothetical protein
MKLLRNLHVSLYSTRIKNMKSGLIVSPITLSNTYSEKNIDMLKIMESRP